MENKVIGINEEVRQMNTLRKCIRAFNREEVTGIVTDSETCISACENRTYKEIIELIIEMNKAGHIVSKIGQAHGIAILSLEGKKYIVTHHGLINSEVDVFTPEMITKKIAGERIGYDNVCGLCKDFIIYAEDLRDKGVITEKECEEVTEVKRAFLHNYGY